ncbi:thioredoxin domain-containing protein [Streptococcus dentapri]|uniref:Thioredoxin domain-containing protein n=1 Tax=Streptococcus dentapri TaxID=573564 RepID=A0ABV8D1N7_9STRE
MLNFEEVISRFETISAVEARKRIDSKEKVILFIGRPTCPFCQRFAPKLDKVVAETGAKVVFLLSDDATQIEAIQDLRNRYGVATVPGLLVAENGAVKVVCDSSLSEDDIKDFIA